MTKTIAWVAIFSLLTVSVLSGWSASAGGEESLPAVLKALATFEPGVDDAVLLRFQNYVRSRANDPGARADCETALLAFLQGQSKLPGKQAACRELRLIGSDASVPVLEKMLLAGETTDMARYALEGIRGDAAGAALVRALPALVGEARLGIISSLGRMKRGDAVQALARCLPSGDESEAVAAAGALGMIGGPGAVSALTAARGSGSAAVRDRVASGLLSCADGLLGSGNRRGAMGLYEKVVGAKVSPAVQEAALRGKISASGPDAAKMILVLLREKRPETLRPAIAMIPFAFEGGAVADVCRLLAGLPELSQVQLVAALAAYPRPRVLPTLMEAAGGSPFLSVRVGALRALAAAGDQTCVGLLADRAARTAGVEQSAARESLARIRGEDVDRALLEKLGGTRDPALLGELIRASGERRVAGSMRFLMKLAGSDVPMVRSQVFRAIRKLARAEDIIPLLGLLFETGDESDLDEIAATVAAVSVREARPNDRAAAVSSLLSSEGAPGKRAALLLVLGKIGEDKTLPVVRRALSDNDSAVKAAAVRAVAAWPTPAARDDALAVARSSPDLVSRVLALQGFVRMTALERYRAPEGAVASLADALALAERADEKRLILGTLPAFACPAALRLAESLLGSKEVGAEARAAAEGIREKLTR
jgi:HEAT repeat protein